MDRNEKRPGDERNPVTNAIGEHPVGTTVGAVAGAAAAGAATGSVAGPVGTAAGAVAGAVAGGVVGKGLAEMVDPDVHDAYWRENYTKRPYVEPGAHFDDYGPAYRYGVATVRRYESKTFDEAEAELREQWMRERGTSRLDWDKAKHPIRDAWNWVKTDIDHD
jgi:hypothetical protein